ncbi:hypothetical protein HED63_19600 [Ochrobactrum cytisi]|nr:hypothetical protein [Brucella cytisi]
MQLIAAVFPGLASGQNEAISTPLKNAISVIADGGLELTSKAVHPYIWHSSSQRTFDTYGRLFPSLNEGAELAVTEQALLAIDAACN